MLGTTISPFSAIAMNEAQFVLDLSIDDYFRATSDGRLKKSVEITTALNNRMNFHNFWDLLEFAIHSRLLQIEYSSSKGVSERVVDEIARCFDQRDEDGFELSSADMKEIIGYATTGAADYCESESGTQFPLTDEVLLIFCLIVSKCASAYSSIAGTSQIWPYLQSSCPPVSRAAAGNPLYHQSVPSYSAVAVHVM